MKRIEEVIFLLSPHSPLRCSFRKEKKKVEEKEEAREDKKKEENRKLD